MIKTLTILYLLGATCFCSASPTSGQSSLRQQQGQTQNRKLQTQTTLWTSTPLQNGNLQANALQSKSQESENEINEGENPEVAGGEEATPVTEDKQLPPQLAHQQQPLPTKPAAQPAPIKRPVVNPQVSPLPYGAVYPNGNHPPGMPITQYSGVQVAGYQKEQTGQAPISQHQQMFYAGGSNSIPMMIYSDSATPPITMFYLGQGDKQIQGAIPNLQPMNPQVYSQGLTPFNIPMPLLDSMPASPVNFWDRQFPMFETFSPQQLYPSNTVILKTKESQKGQRFMPEMPSKPKAAEMMNFETELSSIPMNRAAIMMPMSERMNIPTDNSFNPTSINNQFIPPLLLPQRQRFSELSSMRSVVSPFWGKSISSRWIEPMAKASSNDFEVAMLGSRYTSLPTSPYTSGGSSSTYGSNGQSYGSKGGQSYGSSGSYSSGSSGYSSGSPSSSLYPSKGGQYSSSSPSSSLYSSGSHGSTGSSSSPSSALYTSGIPSSGSQYSYPSASSGSFPYSSGGHGSSGYSSGSHGRSSGYSSGLPISSSYLTNSGQHSSVNQGGHSQSHANSGSQNLLNHDKQGTSFVQPLPNGGQVSSFSTSQKGYSGASQGQSSLNNSNKKYENQQGTGQGSSSYLSPGSPLAGGQGSSIYLGPGSSHLNSGGVGSYGHTVMTVPGLLGAANQGSYGVQTVSQQYDKDTPIIAIVPVGVVTSSDQEQPGVPRKSQLYPGSIPSGSTQHGSHSTAFTLGPRNAMREAQYGLGGLGYGGSDYGTSGLNNQYSNLHNGHIAGQSSGAINNQQYGHENVNTGFVQPLPMGGSVYSSVNSDKGFGGSSYGQGSQSVGVNDQNFNAGGISSNQGYSGVNGLGLGGLGNGIIPGAGLGYGGRLGGLNGGLGLNNGLGVGGVGLTGGFIG